ncbi:MAG: tetratricopeptide repeat protein [Gammaproteobacteria bacterium]|nr:tetratricopeptide repeat protein [Gammaproteobacteria bacterium]
MFLIKLLIESPSRELNMPQLLSAQLNSWENDGPEFKEVDDYLVTKVSSDNMAIKLKARFLQGIIAKKRGFHTVAVDCFKECISGNMAKAMVTRAVMYFSGEGEPDGRPNYPEAIRLFELAITHNDLDAMLYRSRLFENGQGEPDNRPNYAACIALLDRAAACNHSAAMSNRAIMYRKGLGEPNNKPNYPAAIALFDRAIKLNYALAMFNRAIMYQHGNGEVDNEPNIPAAIRLYDLAIEYGATGALSNRAYLYCHGLGEPNNKPNYPAAIDLYNRGIELGNTECMYNRAKLYREGKGSDIDYLAAFLLVHRAAELGHKLAQADRIKFFEDYPEMLHVLLDSYYLQLDDNTRITPDPIHRSAIDFALSNSSKAVPNIDTLEAIKAHEALVKNDIKSALTLLENSPIESLTETSLFLFVSDIIGEFGLRADLLEDPEKSLFNATCLKLALDYLDVAVINYPKNSKLNALHRHTELQYLTKSKLLANAAESKTEIIERLNRAKSRRATSHIAGLLKFFDIKQKQINNSWVPLLISGLDKILAPTRELIESLSAGQSLYSLVNSNPEIEKHPELYHLCLELLSANREAFKDLTTVYDLTAGQALLIEETPAMAGAGVGMASAHPSVHPEITAFFTRINADRKATIGISESASAGK